MSIETYYGATGFLMVKHSDHLQVIEQLSAEAERHQGLYDHMKSMREAYGYESWTEVLTVAEQLKADNERLQRFETAYKEFSDKTDWVRPNAAAHELGMHVADILRKRCDDLTSHNQAQAEEIKALRKFIIGLAQGDARIAYAYAAICGEQP